MLATAVATAAGTATPTARAASTHTRVDTIGRRCRLEMGSGDSIEIYGWLSVLAQLFSTAVVCQRLVTEVGRERCGRRQEKAKR